MRGGRKIESEESVNEGEEVTQESDPTMYPGGQTLLLSFDHRYIIFLRLPNTNIVCGPAAGQRQTRGAGPVERAVRG